ncbi:MAG: type IV pilin [Thermoplasmata archaeon]|nr:type IV pilin [Thermoplasmata archaeon]
MKEVGQKSAFRWRKKDKRGVSPIIATILLVAITVVLAAVLYILISGLTKGPGNTPLGTALTLGTPKENSVAGKFWYNFTVQAAGGGLVMNNLNFQVLGSGGGLLAPQGTWVLNVLGLSGATVASYTMSTGTWASGPTTALSASMLISFQTPVSMSGNTFVTSGAGSFQGTVNTAIP